MFLVSLFGISRCALADLLVFLQVVCVVFLSSETVLSSKLLQTSHKMINDIADVHKKTQRTSAIITYTVFRQSCV